MFDDKDRTDWYSTQSEYDAAIASTIRWLAVTVILFIALLAFAMTHN